MARANVDPAELRRFARDLSRFNSELSALLNGLHARSAALEKVWNDQEQRRFMQEFEQATKVLTRFLQTSDQYVRFLIKKAGHIEDYLEQR
ncbi:MAG: WXG100 family type VII secretion target [Sedimentisphaerales bacterium]|nr:WXG100 family type VII secretion target [Sedimentisphaerales bacterium]